MTTCYFVSDLHGHHDRYCKLFNLLRREPPDALFLGGDLLPHGLAGQGNFLNDFLVRELADLKMALSDAYPEVFIILGNDDGRWPEPAVIEAAEQKIWHYTPNDKLRWREFSVYGYAYVPPTPFRLKDWDRYDVSRFVDLGCLPPEDGFYSVPLPEHEKRYRTIQKDLEQLTGAEDLSQAIFLFHTPPHQTNLDCIDSRARTIEGIPIDMHAGSVAVKRLIEMRQPLVTLHGHIHESARITGLWKERIGRTCALSAAHDGPELALVQFSPEHPEDATRELI